MINPPNTRRYYIPQERGCSGEQYTILLQYGPGPNPWGCKTKSNKFKNQNNDGSVEHTIVFKHIRMNESHTRPRSTCRSLFHCGVPWLVAQQLIHFGQGGLICTQDEEHLTGRSAKKLHGLKISLKAELVHGE